MTKPFSDRELEYARRLMTDFEVYSRSCLKIRTKAGSVAPFGLNRSQRHLHERLEAQRERTGKVRALVLKARQVGISTYIGGRCYWRVTHGFGIRAFILTHLDTASDNLFGMARRFHEHCPAEVRPETGKANAKELSFVKLDSGYKVATAGSAEVGRSETIQMFHGSEVAFWPNAQNHAAGIRQAIADVPGTEVIFESTANGIGNVFHAEWKAAERGDSDYEAIFIPWFWHEEYVAAPPEDWSIPDAWAEYQRHYSLTKPQIYWAWRKNRELVASAGGTPEEPCWQFRQEYPANADEAFQTSGAKAFITPEQVVRARKGAVAGYGPIVLGVDPARGGGDKTGVIDRQGRRLGAHVCQRIDLNDLMAATGEVIQIINRLRPLGLVKVCIDTTGLGAGMYDRLRELQFGELLEPVNFGANAYDREHFVNRRAEMWDGLRRWFEDPAGVQVPDMDDLQGDLCSLTWGPGACQFDSAGRLRLESKDHVRERLTYSPDLGDAAALTFAVPVNATAKADESGGDIPYHGTHGWMS